MVKKALAFGVLTSFLISVSPGAGGAAEMTAQDIIAALKPESLTRSVGGGCERGARANVRSAADTQGRRAVELGIPFEFDSDEITAEARRDLEALGQALSHNQLSCHDFLLGGHTDAKGSAEYNEGLSQRRARAVQNFLMQNFDIPGERMEARGFGEERLFDPADPEAAVNRRVEIINLTGQQ